MAWLRWWALGAVLFTLHCKADACGAHVELGGPSLKTEGQLRTRGPTLPLPANKLDYVGLWRGPHVSLSIAADGKVVYSRDDRSGPVSIDSAIERFTSDGFSVGVPPAVVSFRVDRPPHLEGSEWKMSVDGVELLRMPNYGELADQYANGVGVPKDELKAAEFLDKGCAQGDISCCALLGWAYEFGKAVVQDFGRAAALYEKACQHQNQESCARLGGFYLHGTGVVRDASKALQLISHACEAGDGMGCHNLAVMHDTGEGVPEDDATAAKLYSVACERGTGDACQNLALMLEAGEGVPKDPRRAMTLYARACELGLPDSCRVIKEESSK